MTMLVLASGNAHKIEEIQSVLGDDLRYANLKDFPESPPLREEAASFAGNASQKALQLAAWLSQRWSLKSRLVKEDSGRVYVLADDSGLEVDALGGAPGVHSARFAAAAPGQKASDSANNEKLLQLLQGLPPEKRTARFRCVLALALATCKPEQNRSPVSEAKEWELELFEGICDGTIAGSPRGQQGFGYDPLFIPTGCGETFAQLGKGVKNRISHRAKALEKLSRRLGTNRR